MTVAARREAVEFRLTRGVSQRRACVLLPRHRSTVRYRARPERHGELATQVYDLAHRHPRAGYRRGWALRRRRGQRVHQQPVQRRWQRAPLQVRKVTRQRGLARAASLPVQATHPGHVWTSDVLHDRCLMGTPLQVLTIMDELTRAGLTLEVATSFPSPRGLTVLARLVATHGAPPFLRRAHGPALLARAVRGWLAQPQTRTWYIDPAVPGRTGTASASAVRGVTNA